MTHLCVSKLTSIASDNGLSPGRRQAIIRNNAGILLIGPLGINFSEIDRLIEILTFSSKKMHFKVSSAKRRPFCPGLNVLYHRGHCIQVAHRYPHCIHVHIDIPRIRDLHQYYRGHCIRVHIDIYEGAFPIAQRKSTQITLYCRFYIIIQNTGLSLMPQTTLCYGLCWYFINTEGFWKQNRTFWWGLHIYLVWICLVHVTTFKSLRPSRAYMRQ